MDYQSLFSLKGRTAIITGASKGIGAAIAEAFVQFGANVVISSRDQKSCDELAAKLGDKAKGFACHVGKKEQLSELVNFTQNTFGSFDILVNNAATNPYFGSIEDITPEAYRKTLEVNLEAALFLSNLAYPYLKASGHGSIINVSSIEGLHASPFFAAYNISKAALIMMTKNQALEWGKDNIRANAICPGFVKTKLSQMLWTNEKLHDGLTNKIPLGRMANPEEMAGLAVFLASDASAYMTGAELLIDGGLLNAPFF